MSIGSPFTFTTASGDLPVPQATLGPEWATDLNQCIRDIVNLLEQQVPPSGIGINANLPFNGFGLVGVGNVNFNAQALAAGAYNVGVGTDGELHFRDGVGNDVKITANGAINAAGVSGIGGDYGTSTALLAYIAAQTAFVFTSNTGVPAKLDCGDIKLRNISTPTNAITLAAASGASAYTVTFPTAPPGSNNSVVTVSTAGVLGYSASPTLTSLTTTGDITCGGKLAVTGQTTIGGTLVVSSATTVNSLSCTGTAAVGGALTGSSTITGTNFKIVGGVNILQIPQDAFRFDVTASGLTASPVANLAGFGGASDASSRTVYGAIPLKNGDRLKSIRVWIYQSVASLLTVSAAYISLADGATPSGASTFHTFTGVTNQSTATTGQIKALDFNISAASESVTLASGLQFFVKVVKTGTSADWAILGAEVTYDRP